VQTWPPEETISPLAALAQVVAGQERASDVLKALDVALSGLRLEPTHADSSV
jgi:hypothetical protein